MRHVVVGTAGHIDHGKSSLVLALTGTDPDRLKEEKLRGITVDLGFAHLERGGITYAFVDVPGHERFVRNMLAGAAGFDVVLLAVAADESVMPQTREHIEICRLLGVRNAVVALTPDRPGGRSRPDRAGRTGSAGTARRERDGGGAGAPGVLAHRRRPRPAADGARRGRRRGAAPRGQPPLPPPGGPRLHHARLRRGGHGHPRFRADDRRRRGRDPPRRGARPGPRPRSARDRSPDGARRTAGGGQPRRKRSAAGRAGSGARGPGGNPRRPDARREAGSARLGGGPRSGTRTGSTSTSAPPPRSRASAFSAAGTACPRETPISSSSGSKRPSPRCAATATSSGATRR